MHLCGFSQLESDRPMSPPVYDQDGDGECVVKQSWTFLCLISAM